MASSSKSNSFDNMWGSKQILQLLSEYDELESESDIDDTNADVNYEVSKHDTSSEQVPASEISKTVDNKRKR